MNRLTLAVAGGRKTQSIVDECATTDSQRILVLTYTQANQAELRERLAVQPPRLARVDVQGWFSFLMAHWVRPYLPCQFAGRRLHGLNFEGDPGIFATGASRFLDADGRAYKRHLAQLAVMTNAASSSAVLDRLCRMYDVIYVDEVQDLNGYDLEVLEAVLRAEIEVRLVGDVRQALILTNPRDQKNRQYKGVAIKTWFDVQESRGLLTIEHASTTWRSNQAIADFADALFDDAFGFEKTVSVNTEATGHDGLFALRPEDVEPYTRTYGPLCLRHSAASARGLELPFTTFGLCKGRTADRVLIAPTQPMVDFLRRGKALEIGAACSLYVAVTRARFSVAFVTESAGDLGLPLWAP